MAKDGEWSSDQVDKSDGFQSIDWLSVHAPQGRTEVANARRFLARYRDQVRHCSDWHKYLVWDGCRWILDDMAAFRLAKTISDQVWMDAKDTLTNDIVKFAQSSSKASGIENILRVAAADVAIRASELDPHRMLLNCPNGTVDLTTGSLRPHRQSDMLTKLCPTNFNPDASTYSFDRFLESTFSDQTLIDFMQRLGGYLISGSVSEQVLPIFWGSGSNGKSSLVNAFQETLGVDYCSSAPPSLLVERKGESHPTELANLFGKRVVIASETSQGARLAEATVKQLTGGDIISARRMREDFWQFSPTHKLILCTNHKPHVHGTDHAIWRRLVLIPFVFRFWNPGKGESGPAELRQDKDLSTKLRAEAEGILAWLVRGCLEWQRIGLQIPDIVRAATAEYRSEADTIGKFLDQKCVTGDQGVFKVKFASLYEELEKWCDDNGENKPSRKAVGKYLTDRGFKEKHSGGRWYLGVAIREVSVPSWTAGVV